MKIIRICLMGLVMILSATLNADVRQYHFSHLTMDDGLSHNDITAIIQDAYGFMWFATRDGLNRYDGNKVKVYKSECSPNNSQGINSIFSLCLAPDSTLWMGAQGILCYDSQGDSLRQVQIKTVEGRSPRGMILSVKANTKGVLFFLEKDEGIYSYDPQTCRCQFYSFANLKVGVSKVTATAMWIDNDDNVWIGGDKECLIQLDYTTGNYHAVKIDCLNAENDGMQVITGNGHYIYMGFQYSGVVRYDLNDKTVQCLKIGESVEEPLYVHDIQISDNGLWLATETGLYLYDEIQKKASKCVNDYFDKRSLSDNAIYAVYRDSDNGLWVGTYFGGINYMSINENRYIESYYPIATKTSLKGRVVREIRSDSMGNLWIGTEDAGLNYFNSQEKSIIPVSAHLEHYNVHGLCVIDDELYVGVYSGGLNIYNLNTGAVKRYYISDERYNVQNSIYAIYQDTKGRIWICTQGGLYWFSPKEGTFTRINGFSNMYVHNICEDRHGNIWLASVGGGLVCYTFDSKRVDFISEIQRQTGHWINKVVDVYEDKDGWLWMGTIGYGLLCYNPDDKQFSHYTIEDGFPDYTAFSPIQDDFGDIWVGTNRGLVRLNPLSGNIRVFTKSEGLISNQFNYNSAYKDSRGKLYFGTIGGLVVIDPLNIKDDLSFPTVYLTGFQINNKEVIPRADSPLKHSIIHTNELELEYDQNFISFDFAVLKYAATTNDACCVRLEGLDKDWSYTDVQRISYSDLRPGKYILQIKSKNSVGQWQEARSLTIQIHSPWWKSVWAYTIYCILILALIVLLMSYNQQKVNKKHQKLMQELEHEKERESYHAKLEFITNIAHEIKTPLTLIKTPLEYIMRNKSLDKNTQETLDIMMRNTERLLSLTYQLLDFQRVETKRVQLNFERTDINLLLKSIYRRFKLPSEQHEREFSLLLPEDSLFADVDLEAFTKIISNLFTNASKYSLSEIKVELTTVANNSFCVIVENDGELIEPTMREAIFEPFVQVSSQGPISSGRGLGLPLARSLAQLHGGSLILDTTCIERNRFVLNLPCFHQIRTDDIELKDEESISITNVKFSEKPAMLIVEDNLEMQDFISKRLMDKYDVYRAADGLEALKVLKEFDIDIVVSDIMMPNMDGMELLKNIKETVEYSHIPVILLSAKSDLESRINGLELGADAYIEKPFSLEYLMAQIQNLLMNRKSIKELFYKRPFIEANVVALTKTDELFLKKMNEIIEKNIDNTQFSVDVLTEKMNMSRSSLHRKIKGVTDLTPNDYIRLQRLKRAASLLCESGYRVNEIASLTGFTSASYFTKCFHQHFGMLPKEFIKQSGSSNNLTE